MMMNRIYIMEKFLSDHNKVESNKIDRKKLGTEGKEKKTTYAIGEKIDVQPNIGHTLGKDKTKIDIRNDMAAEAIKQKNLEIIRRKGKRSQ